MLFKTFFLNPIRVCTYLLSDDEGNTLIVDCGCSNEKERERLKNYIADNHLTPQLHLLTHGHIDHIYGARFLYEEYGLLPHLHTADAFLFQRMPQQAALFGLPLEDSPLEEFVPLEDGQSLKLGLTEINLITTPGHTPGGVCYYIPACNMLFSGDTLFQQSIGRTDLSGGDYSTLIHSLQQLRQLPPETIVYPGHGLETTIRNELEYNPYL